MSTKHNISDVIALVRCMTDGASHAPVALAQTLGCVPEAVVTALYSLRSWGLDLVRQSDGAWRLVQQVELLDERLIRKAMPGEIDARVPFIRILARTGSTSSWLMERAETLASGSACLAEYQSAGRGRMDDRRWASPFGAGIYCSMLWQMSPGPGTVGGLGLLVALELHGALAGLGAGGIGIKWPNDLVWGGGKLAGILLNVGTSGREPGKLSVVIGVGVNLRLPESLVTGMDRPVAQLHQVFSGNPPSRNIVAGAVIEGITRAVRRYETRGVENLQKDWEAVDVLRGRQVEVHTWSRIVTGRAAGIDERGLLRLESQGEVVVCDSGDVSIGRTT